MPDNPALAVAALRSQFMNRTFEAIERALGSAVGYLETLVVIVPTHIALRQGNASML